MSPDALNLTDDERRQLALGRFQGANSKVQSWVYAVVGFVFLSIGLLGYVLPGLPGTVFLLMALWFFGQSNKRMYSWMLSNRFFGRQLVDYKVGLGIPLLIKVVAVASIVGFSAFSVWRFDQPLLKVLVVSLGLCGVLFVLTRPTKVRP